MNWKLIFLVLSIASLAIGFGTMLLEKSSTLAMVQGIFKGLGGVFFILYYIFVLLGNQPADKTGSH